ARRTRAGAAVLRDAVDEVPPPVDRRAAACPRRRGPAPCPHGPPRAARTLVSGRGPRGAPLPLRGPGGVGTSDRPGTFTTTKMDNEVRELIIIGGGPAGYTAALYAARANLDPLVIEGFQWGGQLMITSDVENYPGYADGIMGPKLMGEFRRQAERFGAEFIADDVTRVDLSERPFRIWVGDDEYRAEAVIVSTGATARQLNLESERALHG